MEYKELEKKYYHESITVGAYFAARKAQKELDAEHERYSKSLDEAIKAYEEYKEKVKKNLES